VPGLPRFRLATFYMGDQFKRGRPANVAEVVQLRQGENERNATSGRLPNNVYRIREHLTESEVTKRLTALKATAFGSPRPAICAGMTLT
jgi:hypothetical protein